MIEGATGIADAVVICGTQEACEKVVVRADIWRWVELQSQLGHWAVLALLLLLTKLVCIAGRCMEFADV